MLVTIPGQFAFANDSDDGNETEMTAEQWNATAMLNYLVVMMTEVNSSENNRLYAQQAYDDLYNNVNVNYIDETTQSQIDSTLDTLNSYSMIEVKRERLQYLYNQKQAQTVKGVIPNPLLAYSYIKSSNWKQALLAAMFLAIDAVTSYETANSELALEYLQDSWELDDEQTKTLHASRKSLFNYKVNIAREYGIQDSYLLTEKDVEDFVKYSSSSNLSSRIQYLEGHRQTFAGYGGYWLVLSKSYYENTQYEKCLEAVDTYLNLGIKIFKKDYDLAEVLPFAIYAASVVLDENEYIETASQYARLICQNTEDTDWALKYYAAMTYWELYEKTENASYLNTAYSTILSNVNMLVDEQRSQNEIYLKEVEKESVPSGATQQQKKEIKAYNNLLVEERKTALPPIYEPLLVNCQLLFALMEEKEISQSEKDSIYGILYQDDEPLFLVKPIDNLFRENTEAIISSEIEASFDGKEVTLPAQYVSDDAEVIVTINTDTETFTYDDFVIKKVKRQTESDIATFNATYTSEELSKHKWTKDSMITITVIPNKRYECETLTFNFVMDKFFDYKFGQYVTFNRSDAQ